jgi:cobalt-zinc-cadmium efflux system membrane fusion protein
MPGMFAEVQLHVASVEADLTVPVTALETEHDEEYVFVEVESDHFEKHVVSVGRRGRSDVEVLAGLDPGEKVVAEGSFFLKSELVKGTFEAGHGHG